MISGNVFVPRRSQRCGNLSMPFVKALRKEAFSEGTIHSA